MFHKLKEKDFKVLRVPLESGRQRPDSLAMALILVLLLQALMYYLVYYVAAETTIFPYVDRIQEIHIWINACLIILCGIYSIPAIYKRSQKTQYLISILAIQNLAGVSVYLAIIFLLGDQEGISVESLLTFTKITIIISGLFFLATCIRLYILLLKGHYRKGSKKSQLRNSFETTSYIPLAIIGSTGLVFVIQYIFRTLDSIDGFDMLTLILGMSLFYVMIFVLPEQLVIFYCKFRFKSFNFDKHGVLNKK